MKLIKYMIIIIVIILLVLLWQNSFCWEWITFWTALGAVGAFVVAALAIYGEFFRTWLWSPKLKIVSHNLEGDPTTVTEYNRSTGTPIKSYIAFYYHLKVVNSRPIVSAKNCRVILRQLHRLGPDRKYHPEALIVPLQYVWSPAEWAPALHTFTDEAVLDFGCISKGDIFRPTLYITSANFKGFVSQNESVRFSLQIVADNFVSPKFQIFEVSWNGKWADTAEEMSKNLIISEINETI